MSSLKSMVHTISIYFFLSSFFLSGTKWHSDSGENGSVQWRQWRTSSGQTVQLPPVQTGASGLQLPWVQGLQRLQRFATHNCSETTDWPNSKLNETWAAIKSRRLMCNQCCFTVNLPCLCVKVIEKYLQSTHAPTHCDYTMTVLDIFSVDREGERNNFLSQLHNR